MSEPMAGGRRRVDEVLGEGFTAGLESLDQREIRRRRDLAHAEREYVSLVRRLLQGRRDILKAEQDRRRTGADAGPVSERLAQILAEGPRGPGRGEAPVFTVAVDEMALARRRVERLISDARLSDVESLSDDELSEALDRLEREERTVSETRARVLSVHDRLQEEMKRRFREELGEPAG
jgi:hypothetical protein